VPLINLFINPLTNPGFSQVRRGCLQPQPLQPHQGFEAAGRLTNLNR
jgi:hypothetical protein